MAIESLNDRIKASVLRPKAFKRPEEIISRKTFEKRQRQAILGSRLVKDVERFTPFLLSIGSIKDVSKFNPNIFPPKEFVKVKMKTISGKVRTFFAKKPKTFGKTSIFREVNKTGNEIFDIKGGTTRQIYIGTGSEIISQIPARINKLTGTIQTAEEALKQGFK